MTISRRDERREKSFDGSYGAQHIYVVGLLPRRKSCIADFFCIEGATSVGHQDIESLKSRSQILHADIAGHIEMVANYAREVGEAIFPSGGSVNFKTGRHKGERGSRPDPAAGTGDDDAPC
jgi:hypothetical protein